MKRSEQAIIILVVLMLAAFVLPAPVLASGYTTTEVHVVKYANDEVTVLNETTVDYHWLEKNLPIQGDGVTRYYHQGPVFEGVWEEERPGEPYDPWNPDEGIKISILYKGDYGAVKGTDIKDICDYIGGAKEGDTINVRSSDGFRRSYPYSLIYEPDPRQGPAVLCWYSGAKEGPDAEKGKEQGQGYPDTGYVAGMRLIFFADTSTNPWGWHVFGNTDMKECWSEEYWCYGGDYPSAAGTSPKWVNEIRIYSQEDPPEPPFAGFTANVTSGALPLAVRFTDASEGVPTTWKWDFGDGSTSTEKNPVHTYTVPGTYTVTLTVTNAAGSDSTENTVTAGVAGFTASVTSGAVPLTVDFTDASDGKPTAWEWDFGDGETSDEQNPTHTYETAGTYDVTLTVAYPAGSNSVTRAKYITASSGSVPGGGGGGSDSSETATPVPENTTATPDEFAGEIFENRTFRPGVPDIEEIVISAPEIPENLTVSCEPTGLPEEVPEPPGEVYRYYNITSGGANVTVNEAVFRFSVPDTWIRENRIDIDDLTLYRYNRTWTPLKTRWTGTVNGTHTYEAASPGFSLFAISGKKAEPTPAATATPVKTATPVVSGAPGKIDGTTENPLMLAFGHIAAASAPFSGVLDAVMAFFALFGIIPAGSPPVPEPVLAPDPVPATPAPVPTVDITRMQFTLSVLSDPPGALVDIDGEYTGKTTPAAFASLPGGNHTVRVYTDSGGPEERAIALDRDDEILIELPAAGAASPGPLPDWNQNCHGGVYVQSSPDGVEIRVDNYKANQKTPVVIYGLKEGRHTIKVQATKIAFESDRELTWVEKNSITPVTFTSGNPDLVRSIRFESNEYARKPFSINGRYLGDRLPKNVDIRGVGGSYITVRDDNGGYRSYRIPATVESNDTVNAAFSDAPCSVLVTSVPSGAAISIDGFRTGFATPYVIKNVSEGKHLALVSKPGYIPAEQEFLLTDNRGDACDATMKVILEPYTWGSLNVSSTPSGAEIHLYGRDTGEKTPHTFHYLGIGSYTVKVVGEYGSRTIGDVTVLPYAIAECHADLPRGGLKDPGAP
ncbi:MAG TPA: PKD domain-containing protein [Methanoculleus sp.]|uniref:PKD domain-containing protein n=1 Tax=Methanoculleus sp. TaxID=90427 RepID=UPI002C43F563|nr:PKD domain-containing protein [Methanoculleus sp.]